MEETSAVRRRQASVLGACTDEDTHEPNHEKNRNNRKAPPHTKKVPTRYSSLKSPPRGPIISCLISASANSSIASSLAEAILAGSVAVLALACYSNALEVCDCVRVTVCKEICCVCHLTQSLLQTLQVFVHKQTSAHESTYPVLP